MQRADKMEAPDDQTFLTVLTSICRLVDRSEQANVGHRVSDRRRVDRKLLKYETYRPEKIKNNYNCVPR